MGDFAQRTGNLFTEGHFASDDEVAQIQARERIQEAIKNGTALEEGSDAYNRMMAALYGNPRVGSGADADSTARMDEKLNSYKNAVPETANSKAVQIIKDKLASGQNVSEAELRAFFDSAEMKSVKRTEQEGKPSALENELIATIKNDPKAFEEAMKAKGLDSSNAADVQKFSREMQAGFCVLFSEYAQMTLNNVNGSAPSIGEFYKKLLNSTSSNGGQLINILSQSASTQEIFDSVAGKGNVKVVGYGKDRDGYGFEDEIGRDTLNYKGSEMIDKLSKLAGDHSIKFFTVRIATQGRNYHDLTLKNNNGELRLYDNSSRGYNKRYSNYINYKNIKSFYYIR